MTPRTGTAWDVLAVVALLAPLAGVSVPLAGTGGRQAVVAAGRLGALVAASLWVVVLAAGAAPELGRFGPDPLAIAAAVGACLMASVVATEDVDIGVGAVVAPPAASMLILVTGAITPPSSLSGGPAIVLAAIAAATAAAAIAVPRSWRAAGVFVPGALLVGLWAGDAVAEPPATAGVVLAAVAAALAVTHAGRLRRAPLLGALDPAHRSAATLSIVAVAVAVGPVNAARPAGTLVAVAAVLTAVVARRWALAAALPGTALVATALADVPASGGGGPGPHIAMALVLVIAAAGLIWSSWPEDRSRLADGSVAGAVLVAWFVVVPGSWAWAVDDADILTTWDRAAAVGVAGTAVALAAIAAATNRDRWSRRVRN